jgi:hypothetical protein
MMKIISNAWERELDSVEICELLDMSPLAKAMTMRILEIWAYDESGVGLNLMDITSETYRGWMRQAEENDD